MQFEETNKMNLGIVQNLEQWEKICKVEVVGLCRPGARLGPAYRSASRVFTVACKRRILLFFYKPSRADLLYTVKDSRLVALLVF